MILVTGGTGFIGQALIRHLVAAGYPVRTLIRPSRYSPNLPRGIPVEVAVSGLGDERNLRAAMVGVDTIYHLASAEWQGTRASLLNTDIQGTQAITRVALDAGVKRLFYVSHLGADRASAYPVLKAKAIAEEHIRRSGVDYTILRSAIVYGVNDNFTTSMAQLLSSLPLFIMPSEGQTLLQPLWVEDLVACLTWALDDESTRNQTYEVGGPEYLSFRQIVDEMMNCLSIRRMVFSMRPPYLRGLTVFLDHLFPGLPVSVYWIDYLASSHTCRLDTLPHAFHLMPARFSQRLEHLKGRNWRLSLMSSLFKTPEKRRKEQKSRPAGKVSRPATRRGREI
jgi:NADH dehydrogenase